MEGNCLKFIIEDGNLLLGRVSFHHQLVTDKSKVIGGGGFRWSEDKKTIIFFGDSFDFGKVKLEDIKKCFEEEKVFSRTRKDIVVSNLYSFAYDTGSEIIKLN